MKPCVECGRDNIESAKYCVHCGAALADAAAVVPPPEPAHLVDDPLEPTSAYVREPIFSNWPAVLAGAVAIIALIAIVTALYFRPTARTSTATMAPLRTSDTLVTSPQGHAECREALRQVHNAFMAFASDHNGVLPDGANWREQIRTYLTEDAALNCASGRAFIYNRALSNQQAVEVRAPRATVLVYEGQATGTGSLADYGEAWADSRESEPNLVLFVDGTIEAFQTKEQLETTATDGAWTL